MAHDPDPAAEARGLSWRPSRKYHELLAAYAHMAEAGRAQASGARIVGGYARQEAMAFRHDLRLLFARHGVGSVLDYGGGAGDWREKTTPEGPSLADFTGIEAYRVFEPARARDERGPADAVACFDVMEHVFIADVPYVLADIFAAAGRLVVFNIACYPANARLPNGENAHCTLRSPDWWRGAVDMAAAARPEVVVALYLSTDYGRVASARAFRFADIAAAPGYGR